MPPAKEADRETAKNPCEIWACGKSTRNVERPVHQKKMTGNGTIQPARPSVMRYRKLLSRKSYLGLTNSQIAGAVGCSEKTVSVFLNGDDSVGRDTQDAIVNVLKMRRIIDFEPIEIDRAFAVTVGDAGVRFSIRYEPARNCWAIVQESALGAQEVGVFHGVDSERMARFCAARLNEAIK